MSDLAGRSTATPPNVQSSSTAGAGTWTKPVGAYLTVHVILRGGGGGGGIGEGAGAGGAGGAGGDGLIWIITS